MKIRRAERVSAAWLPVNRADDALRDYAGRIVGRITHRIIHLFIYPVAPTLSRRPDAT
ncbi:hypothetical protein [Burkholderia gladioli]|uniref:hypothetical protein n=1 Tax=Burkholderia gladioli TaxID=28095 RepID=UPI00163EEE22|nr:hypothetical protein [Burkholderia gladioli]MDN7604629.1 hypothetical protein [Burkholderia gladioli]